jgi:hypothetical protein
MVTACGAEPVAHAMVNFSNTVEESTEFGPRIIMVNLNHYIQMDQLLHAALRSVLTILQSEFTFKSRLASLN